MKTVFHKASSRGHAHYGWLDTHYTFSFADYYDPGRIHFGMLRVLNDDQIEGGGGFGRHPHDNMEIVTIVLEGELEHKDSMGHTLVIHPNEVQVMSAGTGIFHSEYNKNSDIPVKLFQIWVFPDKKNLTPRYDQMIFDPAERVNRWQTLVSPAGTGKLWLNQRAWFSRIDLDESSSAQYTLNNPAHGVYVFVIEGAVEAAGIKLEKRDGLAVSETGSIAFTAMKKSEILVIEIPMTVKDE
ncbi:MAG: pirin family protein [Bacteroidales bacterium]|jgi:hypothetical protein|nr:pirin family protein [Bacteroidales bacterium]